LLRVVEFTRSPLLVAARDTTEVLPFLLSLLPGKDPAQLAANLGATLLGEALLAAAWERHVATSGEMLCAAPGTPGLVMVTFHLPDFPLVFKVVRDRPKPPKAITRRQVMERYAFVARQDRVGRMADAHRFHAWRFPRRLFHPDLWEELVREAPGALSIHGEWVVVRDVITERRLVPLDVHLASGDGEAARAAVLDYGRAIREMAMSNIFAGDLLPKNFGLTPWGRVVFYDYDEVCTLGECRFREVPAPRTLEEEMAAEPWYPVAPEDVFPEEFEPFVAPRGRLRRVFLEAHGDLFTPGFWLHWQGFHAGGGLVDLQPYESQRGEESRTGSV
jgi:isocitrate dehydrogenase kinase/phosphatase